MQSQKPLEDLHFNCLSASIMHEFSYTFCMQMTILLINHSLDKAVLPFSRPSILHLSLHVPTIVHQLLYTNYCTPTIVHQLLFINYCTPTIVHQLLYTNYCTPIIVHQLLYTNYCTPPTIVHLQLLYRYS